MIDSKAILAFLVLFVSSMQAQNISTPILVLKDGDASASSYSGTAKDLWVNGGSEQSMVWMTFQTQGIDISKIASAKLVLYVKQLVSPGKLQVRPLSTEITAPENNVKWAAILTGETIAEPILMGSEHIEKVVQIDVTSALKTGNFWGLALISDDGLIAAFDSKEGHLKPMLLLTNNINAVAAAWLSGNAAPATDLGRDGDFYLNNATGDVSTKTAGAWNVVTNIVGPTGRSGPIGATGPQGPTGLTGPTGSVAAGAALGNTPYWDGTSWVTTSSNLFNNGNLVGIGATGPSLKLDIAGGNWDVLGTEGDLRIGNSAYRLKMGVAIDGGGAGDASLMQWGMPGGRNVLSLGAQGQKLVWVNGNLQRVGIGFGAGIDNPNATLEVRGTLSVVDGTQGAGKVLVSDASGKATWKNPEHHDGMALIKAGTFTMSDSDIDEGWDFAHSVTLSQDFWLDMTEVTQADFFSLMKVNPSGGQGGNLPVENVSWFDAVLYCNARSKRDGLDTVYSYTGLTGAPGNHCSALAGLLINLSKNGYRLPTEAQWEYACRAGTTTPYYWSANLSPVTSGDTIAVGRNAVYEVNSYRGGPLNFGTHRVGEKYTNNFGLYDMSGNVWEWCNDWRGALAAEAVWDPTGPASGSYRIVRGGGWYDLGKDRRLEVHLEGDLQSALRNFLLPQSYDDLTGFRVALPASGTIIVPP